MPFPAPPDWYPLCHQDLLTCCWLPSTAQTAHVHGDALLAVGGKDSCVSVISLASCAVIRLLKGHTQVSCSVHGVPAGAVADSAPPLPQPVVDVAATASRCDHTLASHLPAASMLTHRYMSLLQAQTGFICGTRWHGAHPPLMSAGVAHIADPALSAAG